MAGNASTITRSTKMLTMNDLFHHPMPVSGYTKLFGSIIASTIWREKKETKIVWITMLAMANKNGIVEASVPGLADMARISLEETVESLRVLSSPDEWSRNKDNEGRRIQEVDGGWFLINHGHYRAKLSADERREYLAQKKRESRYRGQQRSTDVNNCPDSSTPSTHTEAEATTDTEEENTNTLKNRGVGDPNLELVPKGYPEDFESLWSIYPNKKDKKNGFKAFKRLAVYQRDMIRSDLNGRVNSVQWLKDGGQYVPLLATYINGERWNDPMTTGKPTTKQPIRMEDM